ncbi:hypothetical protein H5410_057836, partial [Solanum commersonii]
HDYKNAELRQSEDEKNPELKGDDGKLLKTHNVCLNTAAGTSQRNHKPLHMRIAYTMTKEHITILLEPT